MTFFLIRIIGILRLSKLSKRSDLLGDLTLVPVASSGFIPPRRSIRGSQRMPPTPNAIAWQAPREQVLRFWRAIELFTPPPVPKVSPKERVDRVDAVSLLP